MNAVAVTILWMSVQIALFSIIGVLAFLLLQRRGPNSAAACCATVLGLTLPLAVMVFCPWPRWSLLAAANPTAVELGVKGRGDSQMVATATDENHTSPTTAISATTDVPASTLAIWWQSAADLFAPVTNSVPKIRRADGHGKRVCRGYWRPVPAFAYCDWPQVFGPSAGFAEIPGGSKISNCLKRSAKSPPNCIRQSLNCVKRSNCVPRRPSVGHSRFYCYRPIGAVGPKPNDALC